MAGTGYGPSGQYGEDSPAIWTCPRCGAGPEYPCGRIRQARPGEPQTILGYHPERGMSPAQLESGGYHRDTSTGLWRKPDQTPVTRVGWDANKPVSDHPGHQIASDCWCGKSHDADELP